MNDQATYSIKQNCELVPFVEILLPYTRNFLINLEEADLSNILVDKLQSALLKELSTVAEVVIHTELDCFIKNEPSNYGAFIEKMNSSLATKYPVLDKLLKIKTNNYLKHIYKIIARFHKDYKSISESFGMDATNTVTIIDVNTSLGDGHNGEGTSLVTLSDGTKLIYKPRNVDITNSYNIFIDWINFKLKTDLKIFRAINCGDYGWLEFISYEAVNSEEELQEYYYKAGILLAVTFLLGSKDCHRENVIASGRNPVMIDHETIIQPFLSNQSPRTWDEQHKIPRFSVLESILIINQDTGIPLNCAGYGIKGNIQVTELEKKVINLNTIKSKRVTRFVSRNLVDKNVPVHKDNYIFANDYRKYFIEGFSTAYDMFTNSKEELKSDSSPIQFFKNMAVRYVWRPTFVYFKILRYIRAASFMSSFEAYNSKLYELMSKAYQKENMVEYRFILDFEMKQMLNGDIPIFSLGSLDDFLEGKKSLRIFEYNCVENINYRIDLLSLIHKNEQLKYITQWLNI